MPRLAKHLSAHRERPEARAQGDNTLPMWVGKFHNRRLRSGRIILLICISRHIVSGL